VHRLAWLWIVVACGKAEDKQGVPPPTPDAAVVAKTAPPVVTPDANERPVGDKPPPPVVKPVDGECTKKTEDVALVAACEYRCREKKEADACAIGASKYYKGDGTKLDQAKGAELVKLACELESADGCVYLTRLETFRSDELTAKIVTYYERDCQAGRASECVGLAERVRAFDLARAQTATKKGLDLALTGCDAGDGSLCFLASRLLAAGQLGIDKNVMRAAELRTKACEGGHAVTCLELSTETSKDDKWQALVEKACALDLRTACAQLALEHASKNTTKAAKAIERACQLGDGTWCVRIGEDFAKRDERDKAIEMFTKACKLGDQHGCSQARALGAK
jgi:TPR repeat protein